MTPPNIDRPPPPSAPPPIPQVDDAMRRRMERDRGLARRGRGTTVLTGSSGLPDLGATTAPSAYGGQ
jgi:hypothetical protein